ncbi:MAG: hypothetical protein AAFU80_19090 [Pseudomonadota bacterium]
MLGQLTNRGLAGQSVDTGAALCGIWAIWQAVLWVPGRGRADRREREGLEPADPVLRIAGQPGPRGA